MTQTALSARADITDKALGRSFSYINGKWLAAKDGDSFAVTNPADGTHLGGTVATGTRCHFASLVCAPTGAQRRPRPHPGP